MRSRSPRSGRSPARSTRWAASTGATCSFAAMAAEPRIVCLVPSITELLCDLGLAGQLVGRTGFCIHPGRRCATIPKVGGTKDVKLDRVRELAPTHVVVNVDENRQRGRRGAGRVRARGRRHPPAGPARQPRPLPADGERVRARGGGRAALRRSSSAPYARATAAERPPRDVLYLIWRDPWMTISARDLHRPDARPLQLAHPARSESARAYVAHGPSEASRRARYPRSIWPTSRAGRPGAAEQRAVSLQGRARAGGRGAGPGRGGLA